MDASSQFVLSNAQSFNVDELETFMNRISLRWRFNPCQRIHAALHRFAARCSHSFLPAFVLCLVFFLMTEQRSPATPPAGYYLVWSDEFSGSSLDSSKWGYWSGGYHDAVNTGSAISVSGGHLTITTYTSGGTHYTAILESRNKFHPRYGFLEASIDYNDSAGMWSAFWLQADHEDDCPYQSRFLGNPFYAGSEIDVCEHRSQDSSGNNISGGVNTYIHYDGYSGYCAGWGTTVGPSPNPYGSGLNSGFHTYGLLWNSGGSQFYIDNAWQYSTSSGNSGTPEWILLSSIVDGSSWAGGIPSGGYGALGSSGTKMVVDYVRYYAPTNQVYWSGASSSYWTNSANWIASRIPQPNEEVCFSTLSAADSCNLGTNFSVRKLVFLDGTFTINGSTLNLGSGGVDVASTGGGVTFNSAVNLTANQTWHVGPDRTLTMAGSLSGTNSLTKDGWATLVLSGNNSNFTGTLNVDTASSSSDDGVVRIKNSASISNVASPIWIRNNNSGTSRLDLDGTSGNLVITKDISLAARNASTSAIRNQAGSNTLSGNLLLAVGGANYWIECDGGTLNLAGLLPASTPGSARTLTFLGDSPTIVSGTIQNGTGGGTVSVQKAGTGTVSLEGNNTFTGSLYVDSNSTTDNDGVLKLKSSAAVSSASSPISIRNNTGGSSTLQLDGSGGNISLSQALSLAGRNVSVPAIQNLAGSNMLAGGVTITVGGSDYRFQSDAGTLALGGTITSSASGTRTLTFQGAGNHLVAGQIQNGSATVGLIRTNSGTLMLAGNNTFSGPTLIAGGKLTLSGTASMANSSSITVNSGATFDVSQLTGTFTLAANQTLGGVGAVIGNVNTTSTAKISPGLSAGTLTFSNNLTLGGGVTNFFELTTNVTVGAGVNDLIAVAGDLNLSGTNVIQITPVTGSLTNGRYTVVKYAGARTGGATNFIVTFTGFAPVATLTVDDSVTNEIGLVVVSNPQNLIWLGDGAANKWDVATSSNWLNGVVLDDFNPGDNVTFDDTATNRTVNLTLGVIPNSITVNSTGNYAFSGVGKITGATGLVKNNSGTVTMLTTNDNSGPTTINGGTLQLGNGTAVGVLGPGAIFDHGTLAFNHSVTLTNANNISGSGGLAKSGSGTLNLTGANSYSGGTIVSGGIINLSANTGLGTGPLLVTNSGQQVTIVAGSAFTNDIVIGGPVGIVGTGIIKGPASGSATLSGAITFSTITPNGGTTTNGGAFDGGNTSGGLIVTGPMTSLAGGGIHLRANRAVFSGGGDYKLFLDSGTTVLGANDGLATNAVLEIGSSAAATFDLAGFNQTLNGLQKNTANGATVGNSSTVSNSTLTVSGVTSNTAFTGVLQDTLGSGTRKLNLTVAAGTFTLGASNIFSGDTRLAGGTLVITNAHALRNSTLDLEFDDTGLLNFGALTIANVGSIKGTRNLALTNASGAAVTLVIGTNVNVTNIFYGAFTGSGSVTKAGAGMLMLAGNNTFTGTLNVDTFQNSSGNDGVLRLSGSLAGATAIQIRNQNSATSQLQLDGSAGNLSLPQPVTLNGRNNSTPAIVNLAGDNTLAGNITFGSGGNAYTYQCDADTLTLSGIIGIQSLTSVRTNTFQGGGNFLVTGVITNGTTFGNAVAKNGSGTLTLAGTNVYSGITAVTNGTLRVNGVIGTNTVTLVNATLSGNGVIRGPVTLIDSSVLSPGNSVGVLTVSNSVTLAGTTLMELNRGGSPNCDRLVTTSITYAGALVVTNVGALLQTGDTFDLFDWTGARSGTFSTVTLPAGYTWNTNNLTVDGTISVTAVDPPPTLNFINSGTSLQFNWSGNFKLQAQTNTLDPGMDVSGGSWADYPDGDTSPVSVPIDAAQETVFFRLIQNP
ncbi:MAG: glycosyl hydrolase family protein [Verrucomicrobia bacterium]|nr:MAG: glycosyl hydrolase family protein [Verrucomicrobiota bacterium]